MYVFVLIYLAKVTWKTPLASCEHSPLTTGTTKAIFTVQEMQKFATRYENGYDLKSDEQYNAWLKVYHPENYTTMNKQSGI